MSKTPYELMTTDELETSDYGRDGNYQMAAIFTTVILSLFILAGIVGAVIFLISTFAGG